MRFWLRLSLHMASAKKEAYARIVVREEAIVALLFSNGVIFSIRYCAAASSAANANPTFTGGANQTNESADQTNCLWNSRSGAFSLRRASRAFAPD
jgi:hypothetical protein